VSARFHSDIPALFLPAAVASGEAVALPQDEAQHLRALRLREGDRVLLLDGRGTRALAMVERIDRRSAVVRTADVIFDGAQTGPYIALSFGLLADRSRLEWVVEKGVELGVGVFLPLETERSEGFAHRGRLERVAIAALKQSQRSWLPAIEEPSSIASLAERFGSFDGVFVCHESAPLERSLAGRLLADPPARALVVIGPEGGLSEREVGALAAAGAEVVSLGDARLRAETAAIAAVAVVRLLAGGSPIEH
jgi:16S rRNA (uracil1498-N3)-methyltransferase